MTIVGVLILAGTTHAALFDFLFKKPENAIELIQIVGDLADLQLTLDERVQALENQNVLGNFRLGDSTVQSLEQWKATGTPYSAITTRAHAKDIYAPFSHATTSALTATNIYGTGSSTINTLNVNTCNGCGGGTPGGSDTFVQFNDNNAFGGDSGFTYNKTADRTTVSYASTTALTATAGTITNATTTYLSTAQNLTVGNSLIIPGLTSAILQTDANGLFTEYAGTSCTNQFPRSLSALGIATCASVSLTADITGTLGEGNGGTGNTDFTAGSVIFSNGTILTEDTTNLLFNDTLNRLTATYASSTFSTFTYGSSTAYTATNLFTTNLSFSGITSALVKTDTNGLAGAYTGTSCTNQFPRSLSALGAATCASVDLGLDITGTLTVGSGGTGATSFTSGRLLIGNGSSAITTSANLTFDTTLLKLTATYASTTALGITGNLYGTYASTTFLTSTYASGTALTMTNLFGTKSDITYASTTFITTTYSSTTGAADFSAANVSIKTYPGFSFPPGSNTSTTTTASSTIALGSAMVNETWQQVACKSGAGTVNYQLNDGTNGTEQRQATTTVSRFTLSTNNTFVPDESRFVTIGIMTNSYITCTFEKITHKP